MNELLQQTETILTQSQDLLKNPEIKGAVTGFFSWIGTRLFANKKAKQDRLSSIEQQNADPAVIATLASDIRSIIEDNDELRSELEAKISEVNEILTKNKEKVITRNTVRISGDNNKVYQNISNSTISDNSITQNHNGSGDNIGRDKIVGKE